MMLPISNEQRKENKMKVYYELPDERIEFIAVNRMTREKGLAAVINGFWLDDKHKLATIDTGVVFIPASRLVKIEP